MTSITKELREYTETFSDMGQEDYEKVLAIADRIDTELSERYVALPLDMDGKPIHFGDVMEWPTTGETFEVVGIGDGVLFYVEDGHELADWTGASTKRHHQPDTWESIISDATALGAQMGRRTTQIDDFVARCKALCERTKEEA